MAVVRVGTRGSLLALAQAQIFVDQLLMNDPHVDVQIIPIRTSGDRIRHRPLHEVGGKKLFTKELEEALYRKEIDLAVHSLKDMEWEPISELMIGCYLKREDPRDVWVSRTGQTLSQIPEGARVGTVSSRRATQLLRVRPDLKLVPMRGNVDTRLNKLDGGEVDALVLAYVALKRLGLEDRMSQAFSVDEMVPSPGQGVLVAQCRTHDAELIQRLKQINHTETEQCSLAERAFVQRLGAHCQSPVGAYAWYEKARMGIQGFWMDGVMIHEGRLWVRPHDPVTAGLNLAEQFLFDQPPVACLSHG